MSVYYCGECGKRFVDGNGNHLANCENAKRLVALPAAIRQQKRGGRK